ncbi:hypothetical protein Ga0061061_11712 [Chelatococcus sambhunathii]|uniref:Uncharacterized protein n=1 Tax=Chelatococcus sambhunathii TaxID=363953 RepID=A0ABP2ABZ3_9HYPH|nr:hypothetical protein [Chelatococcus sambhunathii]CUA90953.1 hypothetical protein Ga0061061_11712 [Chelatococcus sambhunathii]
MLNDTSRVDGEAGTGAEENGPEFGPNHNFLADCAATILERYSKAKSASRASLEDLCVVGERLNEAKETLKDTKGAFGEWCDKSGFPFDKTWRARLMKLAANWDAIMAAVEALPEDKRKWSVDGVLAIWQAAEKAKKEPPAGGTGEGGEGEGGEGGEPKAKAKKETEAEKLRRLLAEALAEVERLKAENEALKGTAKGGTKGKAKDFSERDFGKRNDKAHGGHVDPVTATRARKVWALYTKGATEGEKEAAKSRLEEMAAKCGMGFEAFVAACGL